MRSIMTKALLELTLSVPGTMRITVGSKYLELAEVTRYEECMNNKGQFNAHVVSVLMGISCGFWRISEESRK